MKQIILLLILALSLAAGAHAEGETTLDSNTAFYEGETLNYIIHPPTDFQMIDWAATADGYSFAFIPQGQAYDEADQIIGANIFKIRGLVFDEIIAGDTIAMRKHYGDEVSIWTVDSVFTASGYLVPTFFINDPSGFIPNVMISYVNGVTEMLVFELIITEHTFRQNAEDAFIECLEKLKVLPSAELGYN
jgi:hypothetical protein